VVRVALAFCFAGVVAGVGAGVWLPPWSAKENFGAVKMKSAAGSARRDNSLPCEGNEGNLSSPNTNDSEYRLEYIPT
jgi:hypothetical protein